MKKITLLIMALLLGVISYAQNFNYQAVVRDASNNPVTSQSMTVLVRIIAGGPSGSVLYNEVHTVTSNAQGVITLPVGGGTSGANFQAIDWSTQNHWIDIQVDLSGGSNYVQIGTSKLQFVPYAMYALNSAEAGNAGIFAKNGTVVSNGNGDNTMDDFVFGSSQLDANGLNAPLLNNRMFFDKSKAAFRAGYTPGNQWDEANVGTYSVAFGESARASNTNSYAMGRNANATGLEAFAFGTNAGGFGNYSRGIGLNARANGVNATAIGRQLNANSMAEIQLGQYSKFVSGSADTWVPTDRLFVIGNGEEDINQALNSDALVMLKNGNTTLNGQLTLDGDNEGAGRAFTLPAQDGTANQIMQTDGSGNVAWVTPAASAIPNGGTNGFVLSTDGSGVLSWVTNDDADNDPTNEIELPAQTGEAGKFLTTDGTAVSWQDVPDELPTGGTDGQILSTDGSGAYSWVDQTATAGFSTTGNVTSNAPGDTTMDDFVFGSTQIDDIAGLDDNNRIVFDKSKGGAFRAGSAFNTPFFNQDQLGGGSVGFGVNNQATGDFSATMGYFNNSSAYASFTAGDFNTASGTRAFSVGSNNTSSGAYTVTAGQSLTAEAFAQITLGTNNTAVSGDAAAFVATDRLFVLGNGADTANKSDAIVVLKNGNTTINGTLTIDGDNQEMEPGYTFPAQDGNANQVMTTDGSGNVSWTDVSSGGAGAFSTTANLTSNANGDTVNDDFLFGSAQLAGVGGPDDDNRFFFDKSKGAFRAGRSTGTQWDDASVGFQSVAFGSNNVASGEATFASGVSNVVAGYAASAMGDNNSVGGNYAFAQGLRLSSESFNQFTIGQWNTAHGGTPDASGWISTDRLFVIGNGTTGSSRSDALVMLKNGNTTLNGQLTIDVDNVGGNSGYTLPGQDGTVNQVMTTDGSGNVSWADVSSGTTLPAGGNNGQVLSTDGSGNYSWIDDATGTSTFSTTANVTSNANGDTTTDDFVFGSTQLDNDTNTADDDYRMFFDKSKGAFRAGRGNGTQWDAANVGDESVALGRSNTASGFASVSLGSASFASGDFSIALGNNIDAAGMESIGIGSNAFTTGRNSISIGVNTTAESRGQTSLGIYNTEDNTGDVNNWVATDRLLVVGNGNPFGGGVTTRSDALVMLKNGNTTLNGELTIDGDNQGSGASYTLPAQDGTVNQVMTTDGSGNVSWATAASSAFTTTSNVTSNAGGAIATDDFVFGSTQLDDDLTTIDDENRMFFDKSKAAFRAGQAEDVQWNTTNVGQYSAAFGINNISSGFGSFTAGDENEATVFATVAMGVGNRANGSGSVAMGSGTKTESQGQISLGVNNTVASGTPLSHVATDRLFVIGNGITGAASDALVMLKNGNTTLNGTLTIDGDNQGSGASYTLPAQDGTANQVMTTDGSGNVSWAAVSGGTTLPAGGTNGQVLQTDGSGGYSWTNNTEAPGAYTAATLNAAGGWEYYNTAFSVTTFQDPRYRKVNNIVTLEGLCRKSSAITNGDTIMTLPEGYRPLKTRIFTVETENGAIRVDVNPNGTVLVASGFDVFQNWVSLDGLTFSID